MIIEDTVRLDFKDVLIRPKRSTLKSRQQVSLEKTYKFYWSPIQYTGIPIMASNMDGVGTFEMLKTLSSLNLFTCLVKHYSLQNWLDALNTWSYEEKQRLYSHGAVSTGTSDNDFEKLKLILTANDYISYICIDVANGYSDHFGDFVAKVRKEFPKKVIIAGNVVTGDMTQELILRGADIVKVGIGPGCFLPGTIVYTTDGPKPIEKVQVDDLVKTHTGSEKKVVATLVYDNNKPIVSINGIKSTDNHEYYVLHKKYKNIVTDENIHEYAEWIEAKDLTKDYLLLKHKG